MHHVVHLNILYSFSHQLTLLLHRPAFTNTPVYYNEDDTRSSRKKCLDSARGLLGTHLMFYKSPEFVPFRWWNQALGSFHAFHAAVVLVVVMTIADDQEQYEDIKLVLENSLAVFEDMTGYSRVCARAMPILRYLLYGCTLFTPLFFFCPFFLLILFFIVFVSFPLLFLLSSSSSL